MGIDLNGAGGYQRFSFEGWSHLQLLALLNGWAPEGTYIEWEDPPEWLGYSYNSNSGQSVRAGDAWNMAQALGRALDYLVDRPEEVIALDLSQFAWPDVMDDEAPPPVRQLRAFEWYAGPKMRRYVQEFIAFSQRGGFRIS